MVCPFDGTIYDMALMRARLLDTQPTLERIRIIHKTGNVARGVALTPQHTRSEVTVRASMNPGGLRGFGLRFGTDSNQDTLYMAIGDSVDTKFLTRLPHPTKRFHRVLFDLLSVHIWDTLDVNHTDSDTGSTPGGFVPRAVPNTIQGTLSI